MQSKPASAEKSVKYGYRDLFLHHHRNLIYAPDEHTEEDGDEVARCDFHSFNFYRQCDVRISHAAMGQIPTELMAQYQLRAGITPCSGLDFWVGRLGAVQAERALAATPEPFSVERALTRHLRPHGPTYWSEMPSESINYTGNGAPDIKMLGPQVDTAALRQSIPASRRCPGSSHVCAVQRE